MKKKKLSFDNYVKEQMKNLSFRKAYKEAEKEIKAWLKKSFRK